MQSSNRTDAPQQWLVSPMTLETSRLEPAGYTVSPPPYTPTESSPLDSKPVDEKIALQDGDGQLRQYQTRSAATSRTSLRNDTGSASGQRPLEVEYSTLPEVVPSSLPEVAPSTLPQVTLSVLPEVAISPLPESTTPTTAGYTNNMEMTTISTPVPPVTPLHLLGDQPDLIDCPFCERQVTTLVKRKASNATHIQAVLLLMTTVCGVVAPYLRSWSFDVEQYCGSCDNRVTYRPQGKEIYVCKQPASAKEVSKYPAPSSDSVKQEV
ncbi:hypothetical protein AK830_g12120 [Neonectria ditissima]|uniref:LITAF domain-containing protein n=1 Tax=Neonectria ditissima TaxID=78410 RepID=A0A0N8H4V9_9HYPO|nr:hypothetical protein AK830_g12120 [Neonectria ditissima]